MILPELPEIRLKKGGDRQIINPCRSYEKRMNKELFSPLTSYHICLKPT